MVADKQQQNIPSQPGDKWGRARVLFAILGAPVSWAIHFNVMYFLVQPVCRLGGEALFHVTTVVMLVTCIAAGVVAWRQRGSNSNFDTLIEGAGSWKPFVALFGVASAAIFAYAIVYQWTPVLTYGACEGMRPLS